MAYAEQSPPRIRGPINEHASALADEWRRLTRVATAVALLTSPAFFLLLYQSDHLGLLVSLAVTVVAVISFRGLVEVIVRKLLPTPALYGADESLKQDDIVARRRYWYWRTKFRPAGVRGDRVRAAGARAGVLLLRGRQRAVLPPVLRTAPDLPAGHAAAAGARVRTAAAAVLRQLRDLLRAVPVLRRAPDPRVRARGRELGRKDRRCPRTGRGQGGDHPRDQPLAIG